MVANEPGKRAVRARDARQVEINRMYRELERLGERYENARAKAKAIRDLAEPIIVALATEGEEQGKIAERFKVVRETIRRIERANEVDRGDPRTKPREEKPARTRRTAA